jgi:hypothetical protein
VGTLLRRSASAPGFGGSGGRAHRDSREEVEGAVEKGGIRVGPRRHALPATSIGDAGNSCEALLWAGPVLLKQRGTASPQRDPQGDRRDDNVV